MPYPLSYDAPQEEVSLEESTPPNPAIHPHKQPRRVITKIIPKLVLVLETCVWSEYHVCSAGNPQKITHLVNIFDWTKKALETPTPYTGTT